MKAIFSALVLVLATSVSLADPTTDLGLIMKNKVGVSFKVIITNIMKEKTIAADGSTLSAAKLMLEGFTQAQGMMPKKLEGAPDKSEKMKMYDAGLVEMISLNQELIKTIESGDVAASDLIVKKMLVSQKKAHAEFKD